MASVLLSILDALEKEINNFRLQNTIEQESHSHNDYITHHGDWKKACEIAKRYAHHGDDKDYWQHQIDTLDKLQATHHCVRFEPYIVFKELKATLEGMREFLPEMPKQYLYKSYSEYTEDLEIASQEKVKVVGRNRTLDEILEAVEKIVK